MGWGCWTEPWAGRPGWMPDWAEPRSSRSLGTVAIQRLAGARIGGMMGSRLAQCTRRRVSTWDRRPDGRSPNCRQRVTIVVFLAVSKSRPRSAVSVDDIEVGIVGGRGGRASKLFEFVRRLLQLSSSNSSNRHNSTQ